MFILGSDYNTRYSALCFIPQTISSVEGLAGLAELRDERMRRSKHGLKTQSSIKSITMEPSHTSQLTSLVQSRAVYRYNLL